MKNFTFLSLCIIICSGSANELFAKTDTVRIVGMTFHPATLHIKPGSTVVWINPTTDLHTCTSGTNCSPDGKWNSGYLKQGQAFKQIFKTPGSYPYFCIPHCLSGMKGVIVVGATEQTTAQRLSKGNKASAPADTSKNMAGMAGGKEVYADIFADTRIINAQSTETLGKHIMDVRITHRFGDIGGTYGGYHYFYGLDNIQDVRLAVEYGITDNFMVGLGRTKGNYDALITQTQIRELYDAMVKYRILRQKTDGSMPISITLHADVVFTSMPYDTAVHSEAHFASEWNRFSFALDAPIARKFSDKLSLEIEPIYVRRNWARAYFGDLPDLFALGVGGKYMFNDRLGIVADYFHPFSQFRQVNSSRYYDPLAIGLLISTGGHEFTINFSNSSGILENTFIPYTTTSWLKEQFRLGFTISRKFVIGSKKQKTI